MMKEKQGYWIGGTVTGLLGVALVRLLAPELSGSLATIALAVGYTLVVAGLTIIAFATKRDRSESFIAADKRTKKRDPA
jgi:uncharacterized membrane protein HdeD (DUF308 family)